MANSRTCFSCHADVADFTAVCPRCGSMLLPGAASSGAIRGESESHIATAYHSQVSMPLVPSIPPPPPPVPTIPTWFQGSFRKVQVRPIKGFGLYRGGGTIEVHPPGLRILGQHVYSGGIRSLLFLGLFPSSR